MVFAIPASDGNAGDVDPRYPRTCRGREPFDTSLAYSG